MQDMRDSRQLIQLTDNPAHAREYPGLEHVSKALGKLCKAYEQTYGKGTASFHKLYDLAHGQLTLTIVDGEDIFQRRSRMQAMSGISEETTFTSSPELAEKVGNVAGRFALSGFGFMPVASYLKDVAYEAARLRKDFSTKIALMPSNLNIAVIGENRETCYQPANTVFSTIKPAIGRTDSHYIENPIGGNHRIEYKFGVAVGNNGIMLGLFGVNNSGLLTRDYEGYFAEVMPSFVRAESQSSARTSPLIVPVGNFLKSDPIDTLKLPAVKYST